MNNSTLTAQNPIVKVDGVATIKGVPVWEIANLWLQGTPIRSIKVTLKVGVEDINYAMGYYFANPLNISFQIRNNNEY